MEVIFMYLYIAIDYFDFLDKYVMKVNQCCVNYLLLLTVSRSWQSTTIKITLKKYLKEGILDLKKSYLSKKE